MHTSDWTPTHTACLVVTADDRRIAEQVPGAEVKPHLAGTLEVYVPYQKIGDGSWQPHPSARDALSKLSILASREPVPL